MGSDLRTSLTIHDTSGVGFLSVLAQKILEGKASYNILKSMLVQKCHYKTNPTNPIRKCNSN